MRHAWVGICLAVILAACGGDSVTVSEYAEEVEGLVAVMESQFEALDAQWESSDPTVEGARKYWVRRLAIRIEFLEGVRALDPPEEVADQHAAALEVFSKINAADEALAARVATFESVTEHWQWVDTPEGQAADAVLEQVFAFCRASQAEFDATEDREALEDAAWVPSEMKEVVKVALGCDQ